ncbi:SDR family oxidoreductase [Lentibacillus sp. N15]|uniref:SDR family oxidoreductase n=1 Tax=Lentibacillus songyuanensis TaxID=3136161 RepID=UPI0031B9E143
MRKDDQQKTPFPPQHQPQQPGIESLMVPRPVVENPNYQGSGKLMNKVAIISGGDSGIGAATAIAFAKEGADVVIPYFYSYEDGDAFRTKQRIEQLGRQCLLIVGDLRNKGHCDNVIAKTLERFGKLDILVNNHGVQFVQHYLENISPEQLHATFQTNIIAFFYLTQAALPCMEKGSAIVNTTSITAYEGEVQLMDYSSTKGAIVAFTRSLSQNIVDKGIRVNAVAPGPIWTPLIPASFSAEYIATKFGQDVPMKRAGQPYELAPAYVYLASDDSSYVTGQVIHVNGGAPVSS